MFTPRKKFNEFLREPAVLESPNCMGANKQIAGKDKNDMCVCPNENWTSGTDPVIGYVQCQKCGGEGANIWGPDPQQDQTPSACTKKWKTNIIRTTNDCFESEKFSCEQFDKKYKGPNGEAPSSTFRDYGCASSSKSCRCKGILNNPRRGNCNVTSWMDPSIVSPTSCDPVEKERPCDSYKCL